jgi:hypothetical protein
MLSMCALLNSQINQRQCKHLPKLHARLTNYLQGFDCAAGYARSANIYRIAINRAERRGGTSTYRRFEKPTIRATIEKSLMLRLHVRNVLCVRAYASSAILARALSLSLSLSLSLVAQRHRQLGVYLEAMTQEAATKIHID